jgi:ferredoxin-NADP reductase
MSVAQKLRCRVKQIVDHGEHVYTVELLPERKVPLFRPGQFLHLALDAYDPSGFWPESRVFSIANAPSQRERLRISYSVRGRFTARMEQELTVGRWLWVKLPYGEFVIEDTQDIVLFAGGTGITAFTAFLDSLTPKFRQNIYLAYGARDANLLIYRNLVEERTKTVPQFKVFYFIEQADGQLAAAGVSERTETTGRLSVDAVWSKIPSPNQVIYYISGPPVMLKTLSDDLRACGIRSDAIRIDAWE